jgi:exopolysaccharide biosynthesis polyprenyl glycosylphosphotransferase
MLRRDRQIRTQIHQLMDACLFAVSFWLAYVLRTDSHVAGWLKLAPVEAPFNNFAWLYLILIPAAPVILEAQGFYQRPLLCSRRTTAWLLFRTCLFTSLGLILALFLMRTFIARSVVIWSGFISFGLMFAKEEVLQWARKSKVAQAQYRRRLVLAGTSEETRRMRRELESKSPEEIEILAEIDLEQTSVERLVDLLHEHSVNGVVLSAKHGQVEKVEAAIRACELEGVEAWLVADFFKTQISRTSFDDFYGWPVLVFRSTPESSWQRVIKHVIDLLGSLVVLIIVAVPLALVALLIKLTSPGPVLFRQQRSGMNGQPFVLYKLRTMLTNADQLKQELAALNEMNGPVFKLSNDPRLTPVGRILRKFSIDELPQLYNVLRGEMSLVGPRPLPADEVKRFDELSHRQRLSMKPGLTCLWQICGPNEVKDLKEGVRLDLEYIDNWSLWLDLKILLRTVPVILTGAGAR